MEFLLEALNLEFLHPEYLYLLVVPAVLAVRSLLKPSPGVTAPVAEGVLISQPLTVALLKLGLLLPSLILACFVVILAQPFKNEQVLSRNPLRATNIEILLNASRSMLAEGEIGKHCRYCASKVAIEDFVKQRSGNTMGISIFGSRHLNLVPLTPDLKCIVQSIQETYPDYIANSIAKKNDFFEGLSRSIEKLAGKAERGSEQILILVTDGENLELARHEDELRELLAQNSVTLYVAMIEDSGRSQVLARLANGTPGGGIFECRDSSGFFDVMRHIDRMNKINYQDARPRPVVDNGIWLKAVAVLSLALAVSLATPFRSMPW